MIGTPQRRRLAIAVVLVAAGGALAACSSTPSPDRPLDALYPPGPGWPEVSSLQPTLRWVALQPGGKSTHPVAGGGVITDVGYDLRVWQAQGRRPTLVVYERQNLPTSEHRVAEPLKPDTRYFWSVRARFLLDGALRVSPWAVLGPPVLTGSIKIPGGRYYGFKTPPRDSSTPEKPADARR